MTAKRVFCGIAYILFTLLFTGLLICNITGFLNQFNIMPNDFFTNTILSNILNPIHTAIDSLGLLNSGLVLNILYEVSLVITAIFWFLSVSLLVSVLRNTSTRGAGISSIVLSVLLFIIFDAVIVLLVYNGSSITEVLQNYYLLGTTVLWLVVMIFAIVALSIHPEVDLDDETPSEENQNLSTAQQKEARIRQILDDEIDPRV